MQKQMIRLCIQLQLETVMNIYSTKYGPPEHLEDGNSNSENNGFLNHIFGKLQKIQQNEVDLYLKAPRAEPQQDILLWWKANETVYPHLVKMARDYLAITGKS
ncbi:hypothetical protein RclHR1_00080048 [Rhizophagus clarus]|uniref:HAT C-terminal dimerisation domain-containing protein n=2 Tax=Rhizophagus clarus TaxID=94130 RepID=A0A2Z6S1B9_9GLOM|nr:hypothetical protein RclHR1_00080048 [Rhizophagus clarus]